MNVHNPADRAPGIEIPESAMREARRTIFRPQGMGMRLSYKCLIGCRHCYQKSVLRSDDVIAKENVLKAIEEGRQAGINAVGFSGGEPMLCADSVYEGIARARAIGYDGNVGLQTNGFWGKTPESARKVINRLAEAGFDPPKGRINLSVGEFHQEWLPMSTVGNVVEAYWERFHEPIFLNVTFSKGNKSIFHKLEDYFRRRGIPKEAYNPLIYPSVAHVGRANEVISEDSDPARPVAGFAECTAINKFTVEPTGKVTPCCGFNRFIPGIVVGNIYEETIPEIIENTNTNLIYHFLKFLPQHEVHRLLAEKFELKTHYRHKCELCAELFGKEEHVTYLESIAASVLAGKLNPGTRSRSRRFFHDTTPLETALMDGETDPPASKEPVSGNLSVLRARLAGLEAENAELRRAIAETEEKRPAPRTGKATWRPKARKVKLARRGVAVVRKISWRGKTDAAPAE